MIDIWRSSERASVSNVSTWSLISCFKHIQALFTHIYVYSGLLRYIQNPSIFTHIQVYWESRRIQAYSKLDHFSQIEAYSKLCQTFKIKCFATITVTTNFTSIILDVWQISECTSALMDAFWMIFYSWMTVSSS